MIGINASPNPPRVSTEVSLKALRDECKQRGLSGFSQLSKDALVTKLGEASVMVTETKEFAAWQELQRLIEIMHSGLADENLPCYQALPRITGLNSLPALKEECKYRGLKGCSQLGKASLVEKLGLGTIVVTLTPEYAAWQAIQLETKKAAASTEKEPDADAESDADADADAEDEDDIQGIQDIIDLTKHGSSSSSSSSSHADSTGGVPRVTSDLSLQELKAECKFRNISSYYHLMQKDDLVTKLGESSVALTLTEVYKSLPRISAHMTLPQLKDECRIRRVKNFSKMSKDQMLATLKPGTIEQTFAAKNTEWQNLLALNDSDSASSSSSSSDSDIDSDSVATAYDDVVVNMPKRNLNQNCLLPHVVSYSIINTYPGNRYPESDTHNKFDASFDTPEEANMRVRRLTMYGGLYFGFDYNDMKEKGDIVDSFHKMGYLKMVIEDNNGCDYERITVSAMPKEVFEYLAAEDISDRPRVMLATVAARKSGKLSLKKLH